MAENDDFEIDQELQNDREFDAKISRCFGLLKRWALKKSNNSYVYAGAVTQCTTRLKAVG